MLYSSTHMTTVGVKGLNLVISYCSVWYACRPVIIEDVVPMWKAFGWTSEFLCSTYGQERIAMIGVRVCAHFRRRNFTQA